MLKEEFGVKPFKVGWKTLEHFRAEQRVTTRQWVTLGKSYCPSSSISKHKLFCKLCKILQLQLNSPHYTNFHLLRL